MTTLTRTLEKNNGTINLALVCALAALLVLSPAEATLGDAVKFVYLHGASERIAAYAYLLAAVLGLAQLVRPRAGWARWTRAVSETAIVFWLAELLISLPAQVLAWGGLTLNEPRVSGALWILALTIVVYVVAHWLRDETWTALAAVANAVIVLVVLRGAINILHPLNPILGSDSIAIRLFYGAIVIVVGALALQFTRGMVERRAQNASGEL